MGTWGTHERPGGPEAPLTRRTSSGLRSQQSGIRYGLSGSGTGAGPKPVPVPEHLKPGPDGRDPRPENEIPVSGFPLSECIAPGGRWRVSCLVVGAVPRDTLGAFPA
jgi:hypothetical protein